MIVLGLETSCDETAAALVDGERRILAHRLLSQHDAHRPYGGVVPEIAARAHLDHLDRLVGETLDEAGVTLADLDAVAATGGPGLIGGVIVGVMTAKALALAGGRPFVAVNHLEAHALTARLSDDVAFPFLLLLVSGGHCQLLAVRGVGAYRRLGTTIDDAAGECFDKVAKMMGLGHPGGPALERAAEGGDPDRFALPRPMRGRPGCDVSFSGLKTAARQVLDRLPPGPLSVRDRADLAAGVQAAVADVLEDRTGRAMTLMAADGGTGDSPTLVVAGGVAANRTLRARLGGLCAARGWTFVAPPLALCTDNAAMVAWAGLERLRLGLTDALDFRPRPRWPLDPDAPKRPGAGVKA
ncbi:tRNA (adenosine(37)-N6)-threonylcarbamoyltransferase complex transferase subunit TsaD [Roseospira navarrensis]|uniref:tRNA N6-adenosine threonylcarbamoyltransferase n=1 Tax=Roseospira navarrensis TaxID=140058 RepID=A0A7X1ZDS0_9PROT|nr:tRNA (adenosine(37)-N6)-threonylcarbamoyltransferase complex transferase subunit TsaD [Roseospira navarrensis]MQX35537.1 tRNA (adenosine(37)-N6)-threonylcarbamoyltransferase complex transferase subunit TsaD [Roseospira navarrensis]